MTLILDSTSAKKISLLKELALQLGVKVTEIATKTSVKSKIPNHVTLKSMEKTDKGVDLTKANNVKDMMEKIFSK